MALIRFLALAIVIVALLPPGREMLDDMARKLWSVTHRAVSNNGQPEPMGSADNNRKTLEQADGDAASARYFATGSR